MSESGTKPTVRAMPLFSAVAALMSLLTAAAGPFSQTVKVVRADATPVQKSSGQKSSESLTSDFTLEISAIDLVPPAETAPAHKHSKTQSRNTQDKTQKIVQTLSGHWESSAQTELPLADVPSSATWVAPAWTQADSVPTRRVDAAITFRAPIKAGRAPPHA